MNAALALGIVLGCNGLVSTSDTGTGAGRSVARGPDPSGSASSSSSPAPLTPTVDPCTLSSFDIRGERDAALERGPVVIRGVVLARTPVTTIEVAVGIGQPSHAFGAMASARGTFASPRSEISFEIVGLPLPANPEKGGYHVRAWSDGNANGLIDEVDLGGFYAGTTAAPARPHEATLIAVSSESPSTCNAVFGIGPVQCPGAWGTPCSSDGDCRPKVCECADGMKVTGTYESCSPTTKTCQPSSNTDCARSCGAGNVLADRPADCAGQ